MATRDGAEILPRVLDAYCRLTAPRAGWRLLIVDNGSTDGTADVIARYTGRLPLRRLYEASPGKNKALNRALDDALATPGDGQDLFVFTDDDATPAQDWLLRWQDCAAAQPDYSVFGGVITPDWAETPADWLLPLVPTGLTYGLTSPSLPEGPVFPGLVWGANMAVRRAAFDGGHRFDTCVGPNGADYAMGSETELTRRLAAAGYRSWFCRAPQVAHHIRAHQVRLDYILQKAWRFGRGKYRQERPGKFVERLGVPRWMLLRYLLELAAWTAAVLRGDVGRKFRHRWELAFLRGYFHEAWHGAPRPGPHVLVTSYSGELGGMELRMAQEVRYLQTAGHAGMLALRHFDGIDAWSQRLAREQITVAQFNPPAFFEEAWSGRRLRFWRARWFSTARLRAFRADLVHVALCWTNYGASTLWLANHCKLPAVISVHNAFPRQPYTSWHDKLLRQAFSGVRGIYAVSESAMRHFKAAYQPYILPSTRLAVIPNGVDVELFKPSPAARLMARQRLQLPQQALVMGAVARLSAQKRPELLLEMFANLRQRFRDLHLVLAGSGPLEGALRAQAARLGVLPWVTFTGFVDTIHELLQALDLHVLMSRNEGFGIATIEAMACGIAVVATDVPGSADILGDSAAGLLVPADDLAEATEMVAELLADPARRGQMGRHGRREAIQRYSHAVVGAQVRAFYQGLL
ncbi:glycosyltransferase [Duganella sp. PWIR1]